MPADAGRHTLVAEFTSIKTKCTLSVLLRIILSQKVSKRTQSATKMLVLLGSPPAMPMWELLICQGAVEIQAPNHHVDLLDVGHVSRCIRLPKHKLRREVSQIRVLGFGQ